MNCRFISAKQEATVERQTKTVLVIFISFMSSLNSVFYDELMRQPSSALFGNREKSQFRSLLQKFGSILKFSKRQLV